MKYRIKDFRKKAGLTQDELAAKLGSSKSHVSEMETGKKNPSSPMLDRIAQIFGVRPADMIDPGSEVDGFTEFVAKARRLDALGVQALLAMTDALLAEQQKTETIYPDPPSSVSKHSK